MHQKKIGTFFAQSSLHFLHDNYVFMSEREQMKLIQSGKTCPPILKDPVKARLLTCETLTAAAIIEIYDGQPQSLPKKLAASPR